LNFIPNPNNQSAPKIQTIPKRKNFLRQSKITNDASKPNQESPSPPTLIPSAKGFKSTRDNKPPEEFSAGLGAGQNQLPQYQKNA
jgi:hypothetical protein